MFSCLYTHMGRSREKLGLHWNGARVDITQTACQGERGNLHHADLKNALLELETRPT